jgi:outer membrane protein TolC
MSWNNNKQDSSSALVRFNPTFTTGLTASYTQPLLRGFGIDQQRQQIKITQINREISEETLRATVTQTLANVRNAYWDLVFARSAVDVAQRALALADKLVEDNKARVEVGTLAPLDIVQAEAEAANRRQTLAVAEAALHTAELALKRFIVSGTEDPLWRLELVPTELPNLEPAPSDIEGAVRRSLERRTDLINARKNLQSSDISLKFFRNQTLPEVDLVASYGAQGIGGTILERDSNFGGRVINTIPGGYSDALNLLRNRDYPNWNLQFNVSYNLFGSQADAQHARARLQRNQAQARLRALELQVATEVTNAALSVQSNLKRVEAAVAARELAEKRLEAEQSRFEVGMTVNFFVVQAQRDLRDAQNAELRALADYRKSLVVFERVQEAPGGGGGGGTNFAATGGTGGQ